MVRSDWIGDSLTTLLPDPQTGCPTLMKGVCVTWFVLIRGVLIRVCVDPGSSSRRGYCGFCRVLYTHLDQHLCSLRHLDAVRASSRGSSASSCSSTSLLERFLQDVLQHHPHKYNDPRPPHADVLTVSAPLRLREEPTNQRGHAPPGPWQCWQQERRAGLSRRVLFRPERLHGPDHRAGVCQLFSGVCQVFSGVCQLFSGVCQLFSGVFQVIQMLSGVLSRSSDSFHFSLPVSMETQSEGWDLPVQRGLENTPVQVSREDLCRLTEAQIHLTEAHLQQHLYSARLDSALQGGGAWRDDGFLSLPIEEVLPAPQHIPESFRGKSWNQIHLEDEEQVERLVRQFRGGAFLCYFDSESLARYGRRRSQIQKGGGENLEAESDPGFLPLLVGDEQVCVRRRRGFRVASRCQVVKVSRSTQTVRLVVPAVRQSEAPPPGVPAVCQSEAPPSGVPAANQETERTPASWRCLPAEYYDILTPLQSRSSLIYLLSPAPPHTGPAPYTQAPPPGAAGRGARRPLFRSLSPDLNTEGEGPSRIKAPPPHSRGERPRPLRKTRSQAAPPREGLPPPPSRRGRGRRGNCPSK
ncbi:DBF4-type zinc finger-containing protein 2 [Dissostichus eleginoides]|uniref:DBF4-type zinc finger-containing protein 2 n=1 Tax=Dissostichus eleginoides TaxID=100907 RepID=A0AAD9B424_DISEL|nr:DBF4-type zinc finger-containing protein 2 [Dissostichus eleginoides]